MTEWDWSKFQGSTACLKQNRRDLEHLAVAMSLTPGRTAVVQAGGNLGIFPKKLAEQFTAVYTFEPETTLFGMMAANAPEPNIIRMPVALGFDRDLVRMSGERLYKQDRPPHEGVTHVAGRGLVPTIRVDDLNLPICDLMYLDVEGWELYALRGARETIMRTRPTIAVEINRCIEMVGLHPDMVRDFIWSCEYRHERTIRSDEIYLPVER